MGGRMLFPLNSGITSTSQTYTSRTGAIAKIDAFKDVSVNPVLYTTGLEDETDYISSDTPNIPISSAIFTEIRKGPHVQGLSTTIPSSIENRLYPSTSVGINTYVTNKENTPSYKVKIYDASQTTSNINKLATYGTSNSNIVFDIDNYDYFIILNPEIVAGETREDSVRPHFAKITRLTTFDTFGDGVEFTPTYTGDVAKNTNFEIYKGPHKVDDTDVVAVSYGLRGDTDANTDKYDKICIVNRPTFYFYNDRLEEKNQLDYNEKYTVTSIRWWNNLTTTITTTSIDDHDIYEEGSNSVKINVDLTSYSLLVEGMSIFDGASNYLGNINSKSTTGSTHTIQLDFARIAINSATISTPFKTGKTIQNVVFKTESKYGNTIQNLGRNRLDATLVDNTKSSDESGSLFNPIFWHKTFPNMKRHSQDYTTSYYDTLSTQLNLEYKNLNGPSQYITFESAALKNDKIPMAIDTIVNSPRNKISKFAMTKAIDNSGLQHLKFKEDSKMVVRNGIYSDTFNMKLLDHTVSTSLTKLKFNDMTNEYDYTSVLSTGDIVEINSTYYVIGTIDDKVDDTDQTFGISHSKLKTASIWTATTVVPTIDTVDIYITPYSNGKLNTTFIPDTEIQHSQGNRITMDNHTVDKIKTKLYNSKLSLNIFVGHEVNLNYGDKTHKYITIQEPLKGYYQTSPKERMYYYTGGYTIHEEVFNGTVEDIESKNDMGRMEYTITGRDNIAKLLSNTINRNLNFSDDIVYSTLNPYLELVTVTDNFTCTKGSVSCVSDDSHLLNEYDLLFNNNGELIGEVNSSVYQDVASPYTTTYTLKDGAYITVTNAATFKYYKPLDTSSRFISGAKAIASNLYETSHPTDFTSVSEKGLIFNDGMNYTYATSFSYSDLQLTSNDGSFEETNSIGYNISSVSGINKNIAGGTISDEILKGEFLLKLSKENETKTTYINKDISSAAYLNIVNVDKTDDNLNVITVAPNFPVLLGVSDDNTEDDRFYGYNGNSTMVAPLYLLNNNAPLGGYIHKLQSENITYYGPQKTYKYYDLQSFNEGTIIPYSANHIYKTGTRPHKITGYCVGLKLFSNGTRDLSNLDKDTNWHKDSNGKDNVTETISNSNNDKLITNDFRARPYKLYATGDLYPDSYLRYNNLGYSSNTNNLTNFGLLFESKGTTGSEINHDYTGKTKAIVKTDKNYERAEIISSTITNPTQMKRWGVIRLIEATFDWHFNSVDAEALQDRAKIPRVDIGDYIKYDTNNSNATTSYDIYGQLGDSINDLKDIQLLNGLNMTQIHLLTPNIHKTYFYMQLLNKIGDTTITFDPHNVILPIMDKTGAIIVESSNTKTHYSKVLSALCKPVSGETPSISNPHNVNWPNGHIYDNCVAIFKDFKTAINKSDTLLKLTSSPLSLPTFNLGTGTNLTQKNANISINTSDSLTTIGTKTTFYPFINRDGFTLSVERDFTHHGWGNHQNTQLEHDGEMYSTQMLLKPQFNIITTGLTSGTGLTFTMNTSSTHHWLNYVPNLEGYYIVSDKLEVGHLPTSDGDITTYKGSGIPKYIGKIISHTRNDSSTPSAHTLKFDKDIANATHGKYFRLMRISDTTFEDTPDYIEINNMHDSGLKYEILPENLLTGEVSTKNQYGEGIYSMYMLLNIDENTATKSYLERRIITNAASLFTNGDEIDCYITDGNNSQRKSLTVTKSSTKLKFEYDGKLNGNGCVSFGQAFDITIPKKLKIDPTNCYLGTTFSIGGVIENEITNIANESELDVDIEQSFREYTNNIVDTRNDSNNTITCVDNVIGITVGDILYNHEGYLIGEVSTISNKIITLSDLIFIPSQYDEIIKKDRRTFVSQVNFQDTDAFSALNFLANKKGLDYRIENNTIITRNINDIYALRQYHLNYKNNNRLISVESNKSLFDKANKIIVLGDGVKAEIEMPTKKHSRVIRHIDSSIKNLTDAKIKASQLLELHRSDIRKIKLTLQKEGLELLQAGDILTLDFPNHDIPKDDYQVFEIENVLSGITTVTVGTFNKTIAERLSELELGQKSHAFALFSKNSIQSVVGKSLFDGFNINNEVIKYTIETSTSNLGFSNSTLGFTTLLGFGSGSTTLKTYESEKDV